MPSSTHTTLAPVHHRRNPALIRLLNRIPALLLRSPLHAPLSRRILLLTFTGRKSGKPYRLPVSYVQVGQTLLLTSDRPWWKKLHGGVSVHLRLRGQERTAVAEVVTDATRVTELYRTMLPKNPMQSRLLHIKLGQDGQPDEEDVRQALARCRRRGALS
jgi:deazaflavin-dependent oxidoreductase (nitroreductase family)